MHVAITGATGFVGRHLAHSLAEHGHQLTLIARGHDDRDLSARTIGGDKSNFIQGSVDDIASMKAAFSGVDAVAHCAGINREVNPGDYNRIHVQGTRNVIEACKENGVKKIAIVSFFRARPNCGSKYHESKWESEELVRNSGLDYTILKCGMIYGLGDHMLDHLSHVVHSLPVFGTVGFSEKPIYPVAIEDVVQILEASLVQGALSRQTVAVRGPDKMKLSDAVKTIAGIVNRPVMLLPMPVAFHYGMATVLECTMKVPLVAKAQVQMLDEGFDEPYAEELSQLPEDLIPNTHFTPEQIRKHLPPEGGFTLSDLR